MAWLIDIVLFISDFSWFCKTLNQEKHYVLYQEHTEVWHYDRKLLDGTQSPEKLFSTATVYEKQARL